MKRRSSARGDAASHPSFGSRVRKFLLGVACLSLAVALGVAGFMAVTYTRFFVNESDYFTVTDVRIVGAGDALKSEAEQRLGEYFAQRGRNLCKLKTADLDRVLTALPRAREVNVRKQYPRSLTLRFTEREPMLAINLEQPYLVDREGYLLAVADPATLARERLPVLTGVRDPLLRPGRRIEWPRIDEVLQTIAFLRHADPELYERIETWNLNGREEIDAVLSGGTQVVFGSAAPLEVLDKLSAGLRQYPLELARATRIDLRMDRQIVYRQGKR